MTVGFGTCDAEIEKLYRRLEDRGGAGPQPVKPKKKIQPSKNNPDYDLQAYLRKVCGVDLTAIEGVGVLTVQTLVSECGTDMSKFPSPSRESIQQTV